MPESWLFASFSRPAVGLVGLCRHVSSFKNAKQFMSITWRLIRRTRNQTNDVGIFYLCSLSRISPSLVLRSTPPIWFDTFPLTISIRKRVQNDWQHSHFNVLKKKVNFVFFFFVLFLNLLFQRELMRDSFSVRPERIALLFLLNWPFTCEMLTFPSTKPLVKKEKITKAAAPIQAHGSRMKHFQSCVLFPG